MWIPIAAQTSPTRSKSAWRGEKRRPVSELDRNGSPKYIAYNILYSSPEQLLSITREACIKLWQKIQMGIGESGVRPIYCCHTAEKGTKKNLGGFCFVFFNGKLVKLYPLNHREKQSFPCDHRLWRPSTVWKKQSSWMYWKKPKPIKLSMCTDHSGSNKNKREYYRNLAD